MPTKPNKQEKPPKKARKRQTLHGKLNHLNSRLNAIDRTLARIVKRLEAIEKLATDNPTEYLTAARKYHQAAQSSVTKLHQRLDTVEKFFNPSL